MGTIKDFEDLQAWQKARESAGFIYALVRKPGFARDFGLSDQIRRAAGSVMHNIAEGFEAGTVESKRPVNALIKYLRKSG